MQRRAFHCKKKKKENGPNHQYDLRLCVRVYLHSMSAMMSRASSCTDTSSCLAIALVRRPVIFLQTLAARAEPTERDTRKWRKRKTPHTDCLNITVFKRTLFMRENLSRKDYRQMLVGAPQSPSSDQCWKCLEAALYPTACSCTMCPQSSQPGTPSLCSRVVPNQDTKSPPFLQQPINRLLISSKVYGHTYFLVIDFSVLNNTLYRV